MHIANIIFIKFSFIPPIFKVHTYVEKVAVLSIIKWNTYFYILSKQGSANFWVMLENSNNPKGTKFKLDPLKVNDNKEDNLPK